MAILSRQLLRSIKVWKANEFNPYIVSSEIDQGIWGEPQDLRYSFIFEKEMERFSKINWIKNPIHFFWLHEENY